MASLHPERYWLGSGLRSLLPHRRGRPLRPNLPVASEQHIRGLGGGDHVLLAPQPERDSPTDGLRVPTATPGGGDAVYAERCDQRATEQRHIRPRWSTNLLEWDGLPIQPGGRLVGRLVGVLRSKRVDGR